MLGSCNRARKRRSGRGRPFPRRCQGDRGSGAPAPGPAPRPIEGRRRPSEVPFVQPFRGPERRRAELWRERSGRSLATPLPPGSGMVWVRVRVARGGLGRPIPGSRRRRVPRPMSAASAPLLGGDPCGTGDGWMDGWGRQWLEPEHPCRPQDTPSRPLFPPARPGVTLSPQHCSEPESESRFRIEERAPISYRGFWRAWGPCCTDLSRWGFKFLFRSIRGARNLAFVCFFRSHKKVVNLGTRWKLTVELVNLLWGDCTKDRNAFWVGTSGLISLQDIYLLAEKIVIPLT